MFVTKVYGCERETRHSIIATALGLLYTPVYNGSRSRQRSEQLPKDWRSPLTRSCVELGRRCHGNTGIRLAGLRRLCAVLENFPSGVPDASACSQGFVGHTDARPRSPREGERDPSRHPILSVIPRHFIYRGERRKHGGFAGRRKKAASSRRRLIRFLFFFVRRPRALRGLNRRNDLPETIFMFITNG